MKEQLKLSKQLCFPLYACAKELVRLYRQPLEQLDLTYTQYLVMLCLWEHKKLSASDLGQLLHLDSGTLTPVLKRLESKDIIERSRDSQDERKVLVSIGEKGWKLYDQIQESWSSLEACINIGLDSQEVIQLKYLLEKALRKMEETK